MNVLDQAKALAESIKTSEEFSNYKSLKEALYKNEEIVGSLSLFEAKQANLQRMQMLGEQLNEDEIKDAQELFDELNQNEDVKAYFEAEFKLNQMMAEVSKVLGDAMNIR
ncbi:YlbF family regulator [Acidaminobacter sp. JC074]|uniref:YlbF family regulator n=1 Tax=Acidaminobacter sp. JC074 TaxID=2530199 RepID=UPI001F0DE732|nr:YlbF family regulator [Acidaminobacter sp. JC074]MCH4888788.1 YlbF family regulator [Acidaminobacter sp. JC074]